MTFPENCYTRSPSIPLKKGDFDSEAPFLRGLGDRVQEVCDLLSLANYKHHAKGMAGRDNSAAWVSASSTSATRR
jgi:hypothetical protein